MNTFGDMPMGTKQYESIRNAVDRLDQAILKWHRGPWSVLATAAQNSNMSGVLSGIEINIARVGGALLVTLSRDGHALSLLGPARAGAKDWNPREQCAIHAIDASPNAAAMMMEETAEGILADISFLKPRTDLVVKLDWKS